jgi:tetratricopeptide (TPR) repeat protein
MAGEDPLTSAEAALAAVGRDPRAGLQRADAVLHSLPRRRSEQDVRALVVAERAAALALREIGDAAAARARLRHAADVARRHGLTGARAECLITTAFLETEAGRLSRAVALLDEVPSEPDPTLTLRALTTRALLLQRTGRHAEALADYEMALRLGRELGDGVRIARLLNNRAMALAYLGRTDDALDDLRAAGDLYRECGAAGLAAQTIANAAWVVGMDGDVPAALRLFDLSETSDLGDGHPEMWSDRAEIYLRAGLARDALRSAQQAVQWLSGTGWGASESEALLLLARCELETGDAEDAVAHARQAQRMLRAQGREGWVALASYVVVAARIRQGVVSPADVASVSAALLANGWRLASLDLVTAAAATSLRAGRKAQARHLLTGHVARSVRPGGLAGRQHFARALAAEVEGRPAAAHRLLARAFEQIEERRALLGASDLRALSSTLARDIVASGVRVAVQSRSDRDLFAWAERGRAASFRYRPAEPLEDGELAHALTRLRWASRTLDDALLEGRRDTAAAAEVARCESRVLQLSRRARGSAARQELSVRELDAALAGRPFVHLLVHDGRVLSVMRAGGRVHRRELGALAEAAQLIDRLSFARRRGPVGRSAGESARRRLAQVLWEPVADVLAGTAPVLSAPPELGSVAWGALDGFADLPFSVAPSARAWLLAHSRPDARSRVAALYGPGLESAAREASVVLSVHGVTNSDALPGSTDEFLRATGSVDVLHVAAHARLRLDNPLFSCLLMADGEVTGYELERLSRVPAHVVLSCCHAGSSAEMGPGESQGLATTFLRLGARSVVAPVEPLADADAVDAMTALHRGLAAGMSAADALATARHDPWGAAAGLVAFGD